MVDSLIGMCEALGSTPSLLTKREGLALGVDGSPGIFSRGQDG